MTLASLIEAMTSTRVLVVGDVMLDRFVYGEVSRISPEAPIPVLKVTRKEEMLGGAGNVVANLCGLGVVPTLIALTGNDVAGEAVATRLEALGCQNSLVELTDRPTIVKTRFLSGPQQMLRVDEEKIGPLSASAEADIISRIMKQVSRNRVVILSDYGKGGLSPAIIAAAVDAAKKAGIPVLVDPKGNDYKVYQGAALVTPNRKELAEATGKTGLKSDAEIEDAAQKIIRECGMGAVVATRSEDGLSVIAAGGATPLHLKARALEVFDVSGAGDTVIATLGAALAAGATLAEAATLANLAGGLVVAKVGTAAVRAAELRDAASGESIRLPGGGGAPLCGVEEARDHVRRWQAQGLKVGFTNGCFDLLHAGHVAYLNEARRCCDRLVLGLNRDESVSLLKGPSRPVNTERDRAAVVGGLAAVSLVVPFGARTKGEDNTPCGLIASLRPDIVFKGGDYRLDQLPEAETVRSYGGEIRLMGLTEGASTTGLIARLAAK